MGQRCRLAGLFFLSLVVSLAHVGCGAGDDTSPSTPEACSSSSCNQSSAIECPSGFEALDDDAGCAPILPADDCAPGTLPILGSRSCQGVGWSTCTASSFVADPSGWGCNAVLPSAPCEGATREVIGEASCRPIGDCDAPFPPKDATYFVDALYADEELDDSHFRSISAALAAAPPNAVIAVESGDYRESPYIYKPVTISGRCAASVAIQSANDEWPGLEVSGAVDVFVRGLTITGHTIGVRVAGGSIHLDQCVVEGNEWVGVGAALLGTRIRMYDSVVRGTVAGSNGYAAFGVLAAPQTQVNILDSAIVGNEFANVGIAGENAGGLLSRSVVRAGVPQTSGMFTGIGGIGLYVSEGGSGEVEDSVLVDNHRIGIFITDGDANVASSAHVARSLLVGTMPDFGGLANNMEVNGGSQVLLEHSFVSGGTGHQVSVYEPSSLLRMNGVVLTAPQDESDTGVGVAASDDGRVEMTSTAVVSNRLAGILAQRGGQVVAERSIVRDQRPALVPAMVSGQSLGNGAVALPGSRIELKSTALINNRSIGLFARGGGATVSLASSIIDGVAPDESGLYGRGINVQDGAELDATGSAVLHTMDIGVAVFSAGATIEDSSIIFIEPSALDHTLGVGIAGILSARINLERTTIASSVGVGFLASGGSAFIGSSFISQSKIGIHVQDGSSLLEQAAPSSDPFAVVLSPDTRFISNESRVGSGTLPVPPAGGSE